MVKKEDKVCEKAQSKNQSLDIWRLALNNSQAIEVGTFGEIFSNQLTAFNEHIGNICKPRIPTALLQVLLTKRCTFGDKKKG